jgi:hypothetical protein
MLISDVRARTSPARRSDHHQMGLRLGAAMLHRGQQLRIDSR